MIRTLISGKRYKVVGSRSGHGSQIGAFIVCTSAGGPWTCGNETFSFTGRDESTGGVYTYYACDVEEGWANRKEHAEHVLKEIKDLEVKIKSLNGTYEKLTKYDSDEEEIASMIVKAIKGADSEKESIANLSKMLKGRLRTDLL